MQWLMMQQEKPEDFVVATGFQFSVRQFIVWSAEELGITLKFEGEGVDENATVAAIHGDKASGVKVGDVILKIDPRYFRPTEVETLLGDPAKAKLKLGWVPEITVQQMCAEMTAADLEEASKVSLLKRHGFHAGITSK
jgi:GDPmannose 4,6-dehydratase